MKAITFSYYLIGILLLFPQFLTAQFALKGVVTHAETGEPLEAVHLFIANTSKGTYSDEAGHFLLKDIPLGSQELVVSYLGFATQVKRITYQLEGVHELILQLEPTSVELATVNVVSQRHKKWSRYLGRFEKAFFGQTDNAKGMSILNPEVLQFEVNGGVLSATAKELLRLKNEALGYELDFFLEHFELKGTSIAFGGKPLFAPLTTDSPEKESRWQTKRAQTYLGSRLHFLRALMRDELKESGYEIFYAKLVNNSDFETIRGMKRSMLIVEKGTKTYLQMNDFLKVIYTKETDQMDRGQGRMGRSMTGLGRRAEKDMIMQEMNQAKSRKSDGQVSYLFGKKRLLEISQSGQLKESQYLLEYGYWTNEGVADWLPMEYDKTSIVGLKQNTAAMRKNGFLLSNLWIPAEEIRSGGPPRDGIPAINKPQFMAAKMARFIGDKEYVLGVHLNGIAKAYPIKIMDRHEVVNDRFDTTRVAVTYCPLCGSGIAFEAMVNNQAVEFGVSGLLYNSDVLLYDRQTESLWSQIESQAIAGTAVGQQLKIIPTSFMTWQKWKERFPKTLVLTTETGFSINYDQKAYMGYEASPKLFFPVANKSKRLKKKARVLGLEINGKYKAYPLATLAKKTLPYKDKFEGKTIWVQYEAGTRSAYLTDENGAEIPTVSLYWFAWYAFHPQTTVLD